MQRPDATLSLAPTLTETTVAGMRVCFRFPDAQLADLLTRALIAGAAPAARSLAVQVRLDPRPVHGRRELSRKGGVVTLVEPWGGRTTFDADARTVVYSVPSPDAIPWYELASPFRTAFHWALAGEATHLVHAAAVGRDGAGVLLGGPGGAGKTSAALAAVATGLDYAGDDYVLLDIAGAPVARGVYATAKVVVDAYDEKAVLHVDRAAAALGVAAVAVPARAARSQIVPISPVDALRSLLPTTMFQLPGHEADALRVLGAVVRAVPSYRLDLSDPVDAPELIESLLR